jgi:hypothetical protein
VLFCGVQSRAGAGGGARGGAGPPGRAARPPGGLRFPPHVADPFRVRDVPRG